MNRRFDSVRPLWSFAALFRAALAVVVLWIGFLPTDVLRAERVDYSADELLTTTRVNLASLGTKPVAMAEVFALVETQTKLKFFYVANRIPIDGQMVFESASSISLAELFSNITLLANVVFQRHDLKVIVRAPLPNSGSAPQPPGQTSPVSGAH